MSRETIVYSCFGIRFKFYFICRCLKLIIKVHSVSFSFEIIRCQLSKATIELYLTEDEIFRKLNNDDSGRICIAIDDLRQSIAPDVIQLYVRFHHYI